MSLSPDGTPIKKTAPTSATGTASNGGTAALAARHSDGRPTTPEPEAPRGRRPGTRRAPSRPWRAATPTTRPRGGTPSRPWRAATACRKPAAAGTDQHPHRGNRPHRHHAVGSVPLGLHPVHCHLRRFRRPERRLRGPSRHSPPLFGVPSHRNRQCRQMVLQPQAAAIAGSPLGRRPPPSARPSPIEACSLRRRGHPLLPGRASAHARTPPFMPAAFGMKMTFSSNLARTPVLIRAELPPPM